MALPEFTMRQLMEAGVHFGHRVHRWDPKMAPYIYGARSGIHIIDLSQTVPLLYRALDEIRKTAAKGGRILFVGTKRQASQAVAEAADRCAQYYMNHRWLGGTLTNWETVSKSIKRLRELDELLEKADESGLTKKELLGLTRERDKHQRTLGGIRNMGGRPDLVFVIDIHREAIAVREARKLGVPIVGIIDTNCDPGEVDIPVPGNDDAIRAVRLYCDLVADAVLDGMGETAMAQGVDPGELEEIAEPVLSDAGDGGDAAPAERTQEEKAEVGEVVSEKVDTATQDDAVIVASDGDEASGDAGSQPATD